MPSSLMTICTQHRPILTYQQLVSSFTYLLLTHGPPLVSQRDTENLLPAGIIGENKKKTLILGLCAAKSEVQM